MNIDEDDKKKIYIFDLDNYHFERGNFHYIAEDVDFYFKNNKGSNLVILFHGALSNINTKNIIFRGYDYSFDDTDILCLSDRLIKIWRHKGLLLSWYLSTPYYDNLSLYIKIFNKIISNKYKKIIFTGTSGGGYPALIFSSLYRANCLISNAQIYLNKYRYFKNMIDILKIRSEDVYIYDIEDFMSTYGFPESIILYSNTRDTQHHIKHSLPFFDFIMNNNSSIITPIFFSGDDPPLGKSSHHVLFPNIDYHTAIFKSLQN